MEPIPKTMPDFAMEKKLAANLDYQYPYVALHGVCAKAAVSELAESAFSARFAATSRPAFLYEKGLTPAERGTALHAYLQFADYKAAADDPEEELSRLVAEKYLTPAEAQTVDLDCIKAFFASPLMKRISLSPHYEREVRFSAEIPAGRLKPELKPPMSEESVVLQGAVDLVFEENGSLVIVDYKTDRIRDPLVLWEHYRGQLALYQEELTRCTGKRVKECLLYSFYLNTEIKGKV